MNETDTDPQEGTRNMDNKTTKRSPSITHSCTYHAVFCTKYRKPVLTDEVIPRLTELAYEAATAEGFEILDMDVAPDQVRLTFACEPHMAPHTAVRRLKRHTSPQLRREFAHLKSRLPTLWTNNYFITTTGSLDEAAVEAYVESQTDA